MREVPVIGTVLGMSVLLLVSTVLGGVERRLSGKARQSAIGSRQLHVVFFATRREASCSSRAGNNSFLAGSGG